MLNRVLFLYGKNRRRGRFQQISSLDSIISIIYSYFYWGYPINTRRIRVLAEEMAKYQDVPPIDISVKVPSRVCSK